MNKLDAFPRDEQGRLVLPSDITERFWNLVDRRKPDAGCWEWLGNRTSDNYGFFVPVTGGGSAYCHRFAYEIACGPIPPKLVVHHRCHNRSCVNPAHLEAITHEDNVRDSVKGKTARPHGYVSRELRAPEERFWDKVDKSSGVCWLWTGAKTPTGHGQFCQGKGYGKRIVAAHRFSYALLHGPIPEGMYVCHNCPGGDNASCVNPQHLWLGTHGDNMRDMFAKGTDNHVRGSKHPLSKLDDDTVLKIRQEFEGGASVSQLSRKYGLSRPAMKRAAVGTGYRS